MNAMPPTWYLVHNIRIRLQRQPSLLPGLSHLGVPLQPLPSLPFLRKRKERSGSDTATMRESTSSDTKLSTKETSRTIARALELGSKELDDDDDD
jgi:hypothetical protein